ncbi:MAG: PaREP1 family protein [Dehalococcoidia bacterium]|nr:PaREP1 family protein [Dehalococcoidia bacterium]
MTTQTESHMTIGRRLLLHADDQFTVGDFIQTSEKAWGAVAQFLKAHAESRGLPHSSHYDLRQVVTHLVRETGIDRIRELFAICESLHANYYEVWMSEDELEGSIANVKELIALLEEIPMPDTAIRESNGRQRQFFVTRDGSI